jgi:hypothetical protein
MKIRNQKTKIMEKIISMFTSKPVDIIEEQGFFKKSFRYIFLFATLVIAAYGIYSLVSVGIDYFKMVFELEAFQIIRHLLLFLFCLVISVLCYIIIAGALYHRSRLIFVDTTTNLVDIMPGVFKTVGLISAIIPFAIGLVGFLSALLAATPFFPMEQLSGILSGITIIDMPSVFSGFAVDGFEAYVKQLFGSGFVLLILSIFAAFINLVAMYLISAIYKLVVDFLRK